MSPLLSSPLSCSSPGANHRFLLRDFTVTHNVSPAAAPHTSAYTESHTPRLARRRPHIPRHLTSPSPLPISLSRSPPLPVLQTASFSIPVLEKVDVAVLKTQALILVPTRELALQTSSVLKKLGQHIPHLSVIVSTGGTDLKEDIIRLMKPVHIIVATPGRILDLCNKVPTTQPHSWPQPTQSTSTTTSPFSSPLSDSVSLFPFVSARV